MATCPINRAVVAAVVHAQGQGTILLTSLDGGTTWTLADSSGVSSAVYTSVIVAGDNPTVLYVLGVNGTIVYSDSFWITFDPRGPSSSGEIVNICGG